MTDSVTSSGWQNVCLGAVADRIDYGLTASAVTRADGPRFLRITDIQDDHVDWASVPSCDARIDEIRASELRSGDLVFARTGATTGKSFLIRQCPEGAVFASYLIRVRPSHAVNSMYLSFFFRSEEYWSQIRGTMVGAGQPGVNASRLKEIRIPIPFPDDPVRSLAEQKRIAAILDKADAIRQKRREGPPLWRASVVSEINAIIDVSEREKWPTVELDELICPGRPICYGILMPGPDDINGHPYVRVVDIHDDRVCVATVRRTSPAIYRQYLRSVIKTGDLLLSIRGHVGRMAITPAELDGANITQDTARLSIVKQSLATYVFWYLNSLQAKRWMDRHVRGVAVRGINIGDVRRIPVPHPPDSIASRFSRFADDVMDARIKSELAESESDGLFGSLVQRAFRGYL